jgi:hypothetical protein
MMITCPICLGIAEPSAWAKSADTPLEECRDCGRIWAEEDRQKLWSKYQIEGMSPSRGHGGKVFND